MKFTAPHSILESDAACPTGAIAAPSAEASGWMLHPQTSYLRRVEEAVSVPTKWLDLGCGRSMYPPWLSAGDAMGKKLASRASFVVGLDIDLSALKENRTLNCKVIGNSATLPFRSESFDLITRNMVFEHLLNPVETICEIMRMLRRGGCVIIHTANTGDIVAIIARIIPNRFHSRVVSEIEGLGLSSCGHICCCF